MGVTGGENSVKVAVRCRPLSKREEDKGATQVVEIDGNQITIDGEKAGQGAALSASNNHSNNAYATPGSGRRGRNSGKRQFTFDFCYGEDSEQEQVFEDIGRTVLDNAFGGYNASVFAYGQTGSGKTHTMLGDGDTGPEAGLIPRICCALVAKLGSDETVTAVDESQALEHAAETRYKLEASYLEIYNEKCIDLLAGKKQSNNNNNNNQNNEPNNLRVREHPKTGPYVEDLTSVPVKSMKDIADMMAIGSKARTVAATNMNSKSSRSHAIFTLVFTQTNIASDLCSATDTVSKINLVDLAGSERVSASGVQGKQRKEAANINRSLHTLGRVINALSRVGKPSNQHSTPSASSASNPYLTPSKENSSGASNGSRDMIPYRDSTLTWLLKPSLGGNSRTTMLATVSPASYNFDESLTTLRYAQECSRVVNKAVVNRDANDAVVEELRTEIDLLRQRLAVQTEASQEMMTLNEELQQHKRAVEIENLESKKMIEQVDQKYKSELKTKETLWEEHRSSLEEQVQAKSSRIGSLEKQIHDIEAKLAEETSLKEALEASKTSLEQASSAQADKLLKQEEAIKWHEEKLETYRNSQASLEQELQNKRDELEQATTAAEQAEKELRAKLVASGKENDGLKEDLKALQDQTSSRINSLCSELEAKATEVQAKADEIAEKQGTISKLKEEHADLAHRLDEAKSNIESLEGQKASLQNDLAAEKALLATTKEELEAKTTEMQNLVKQSEADVEAHREKVETLDSAIKNLQEEKKDVEDTLAQEQAARAKANEEIAQRAQAHDELESNKAALEAKLQGEIADLEAEICKLESSNAQLETDLENEQSSLREAKQDGETKQGKIGELSSQIEELQASSDGKIKELQDSVGSLEIVQGKLEAQVTDLESNLASQEAKVAALETTVDEKRGEIKSLEETRDSLQHTVEEKSATVSERESSISELEKAKASVEATLTLTKSQLEMAQQEIASLQASVQDLKQQLEAAGEKHDELTEELQAMKASTTEQIEQLEQDLSKKSGDIELLSASKAELEASKIALEATIREREDTLAAKAKLIEEHQASIASLEKSKAELEQAKDSNESEIANKKAEVESLQQELELTKAHHDKEVEETKVKTDAHAADMLTKQRDLEADIVDKTETIATRERELEELNKAHKELTDVHDALVKDHDTLSQEQKLLQSHHEHATEENKEMQARITALEASKAELESFKAVLESETAELKAVRQDLESKIERLEAESKSLGEAKSELENELEKAQATREKAEATLAQAQEEIKAERQDMAAKSAVLEASQRQCQESFTMTQAELEQARALAARASGDLATAEKLSAECDAERERLQGVAAEQDQVRNELEKREEQMDAKFERDIRASHKSALREMQLRNANRQALRDLEAAHAEAMRQVQRKHEAALEGLRMEFALERQDLTEANLDLRRQLVEEKELRQKEAERYSSLFHNEEKDIERQISKAENEVSRLQAKLNQARSEREMSQQNLRNAEIKLQEKEQRLMCEEANAFKQWLTTTGITLLKFPRTGKKPRYRVFTLSSFEAEGTFTLMVSKSGTSRKVSMIDKKRGEKRIELTTAIRIQKGCSTETFQRSSSSPDPALCFSLIAPDRTYDLECASASQCDKLVHGFRLLIEQLRNPSKFELAEDEEPSRRVSDCFDEGTAPPTTLNDALPEDNTRRNAPDDDHVEERKEDSRAPSIDVEEDASVPHPPIPPKPAALDKSKTKADEKAAAEVEAAPAPVETNTSTTASGGGGGGGFFSIFK